MSIELISEKIVKANKEYGCDAYDFLFGHYVPTEELPLTGSEIKHCNTVKPHIKKGELHLVQTCKRDGEIYNVRVNPVTHNICLKYDCYH